MLDIDGIARALRASRGEFADAFLQAQTDLTADDRTEFEAVGRVPSDLDAYKLALVFAEQHGWLGRLISVIVQRRLESGALTQALTEDAKARTNDPMLEAMTNVAAGFDQPHIVYRGIADGMEWTAKILVDGAARGTGILVGPNLLLTAWHVVRPLFETNAQGEWIADPTGGTRIEVHFDEVLTLVQGALQPKPVLVSLAHKDWLVGFCVCHQRELADRLPDDLAQLDGFWDYAVIRIAKPVGIERRWAAMDARAVVPAPTEKIVLFQHPGGHALRVDTNYIAAHRPETAAAVPRLRFLHLANAGEGSSGGPCFDKRFMLFGLHQGQWIDGPNGEQVTNRGIPLTRIFDHLQGKLPGLDPQDSPLWNLGPTRNNVPVFGSASFQGAVWRSALSTAPIKLLVIGGDERSGKTFLTSQLMAMLPDGGHLKVPLSAEAISRMDAAALAEAICSLVGSDLLTLRSPAEFDSTRAAWRKDEVLRTLLATLDRVRGGRLVWVVITDLNKFAIKGTDAGQLLLLLYEQLNLVEWLRVVLDGMSGDVPAGLEAVVDRQFTLPISQDDIVTYVKRAFASYELPFDKLLVTASVKPMMRRYDKARADDKASAVRGLALDVMEFIENCLATAEEDR